jgi:FADH2 O2-dependent halogenase
VRFDLAIVGSGFGGSLMAMIASRLGMRTILLERGRHPRFAIGESASPLAGVILEQLANRYDLPRIRPLASYGAWQRAYPDLVCGLKRGFTYYKHEAGERYASHADRTNQLLVAASPTDAVSDTHWLRADVDHFLVREAIAIGAEYVDHVALDTIEWRADGRATLAGRRRAQPIHVEADFVIDATGPRGFLSRALRIDPRPFDGYPSTQALYSHFVGVERCADMPEYATGETPPYPIDAAALHHVFDEGWMWVLRFENGVSSAGVAVTDALAADLRLADGERAWKRLLARYPSIEAQFASASAIREFTWMPRMAYRASNGAGERWAMLPSSAAFVDPLFSTGIPLTLLGIERLAAQFAGATDAPDHAEVTLTEADHTARFIAGCYAGFPRFHEFVSYSMFYFAAASFSEMARRLNRPSPGFLCAHDRAFADSMRRLSPATITAADGLDAAVARAVEHRNIAGLCDPRKRNWYGVDPGDAIRGASKLGAGADEVAEAVASMLAGATPRIETST